MNRPQMIRRAPPPAQPPSWRDHPIMIAVISAGATATFMSGVAIPLVTGHLSSQVETLRTTISAHSDTIRDLNVRLDNASKFSAEQKSELEAAKAREREAHRTLVESRIKNPFEPGSPYPKGHQELRIGMSIELVRKHPGAVADEPGRRRPDRWVSVKSDASVFSQVTYYFDEDSKKPTITHILFHSKEPPASHAWMKSQLVAAFGEPSQTLRRAVGWNVGNTAIRLREDSGNIVLLPKSLALVSD